MRYSKLIESSLVNRVQELESSKQVLTDYILELEWLLFELYQSEDIKTLKKKHNALFEGELGRRIVQSLENQREEMSTETFY